MKGAQPNGLGDYLVAALLSSVQPFYRAASAVRRVAFGLGFAETIEPPAGVRVVSIGNLTLGGSGKTPLAIALARHFKKDGKRVAVILRGYGSPAARGPGPTLVRDAKTIHADVSDVGDEAAELAAALPGCVVIVSPRRSEGVELAASSLHRCKVVLLDDAFQHLRMRRHVDLVVLDMNLPNEAWRLFPRGYMREPWSALRRAHAIVNFADESEAERSQSSLPQEAHRYISEIETLRARRRARGLIPLRTYLSESAKKNDPVRPPDSWPALLFAGVAHPERVVDTLLELGADPAHLRIVPLDDHHRYSPADVRALSSEWTAWRESLPQDLRQKARMVCTAKDAVKLSEVWSESHPPLEVIALEVELIDPEAWRAVLEYEQMP